MSFMSFCLKYSVLLSEKRPQRYSYVYLTRIAIVCTRIYCLFRLMYINYSSLYYTFALRKPITFLSACQRLEKVEILFKEELLFLTEEIEQT